MHQTVKMSKSNSAVNNILVHNVNVNLGQQTYMDTMVYCGHIVDKNIQNDFQNVKVLNTV